MDTKPTYQLLRMDSVSLQDIEKDKTANKSYFVLKEREAKFTSSKWESADAILVQFPETFRDYFKTFPQKTASIPLELPKTTSTSSSEKKLKGKKAEQDSTQHSRTPFFFDPPKTTSTSSSEKELKKKIAEQNKERQKLRDRRAQDKKTIKELKNKIDRLQQESNQLKEEKSKLHQQILKLQDEMSKIQAERNKEDAVLKEYYSHLPQHNYDSQTILNLLRQTYNEKEKTILFDLLSSQIKIDDLEKEMGIKENEIRIKEKELQMKEKNENELLFKVSKIHTRCLLEDLIEIYVKAHRTDMPDCNWMKLEGNEEKQSPSIRKFIKHYEKCSLKLELLSDVDMDEVLKVWNTCCEYIHNPTDSVFWIPSGMDPTSEKLLKALAEKRGVKWSKVFF